MATAVAALLVAACNNSSEQNKHDGHEMAGHDNGHMANDKAGSAKTVQAYFTQVDACEAELWAHRDDLTVSQGQNAVLKYQRNGQRRDEN